MILVEGKPQDLTLCIPSVSNEHLVLLLQKSNHDQNPKKSRKRNFDYHQYTQMQGQLDRAYVHGGLVSTFLLDSG